MTVLTITLNPAIDLTVVLERLEPGAVQRASKTYTHVGGKGINAAGCLADWNVPVVASGLLGHQNDAAFSAFFRERGIVDRCVRIEGETRTNLKLVATASGETTDINLPGTPVGAQVVDRVLEAALGLLTPGMPVVLAGSLPPGLHENTWIRLCEVFLAAGARVVLDSSGPPLSAAVHVPTARLPSVLKPNRSELEALFGGPLRTQAELLSAAAVLVSRGAGLVVVSLGAEGALFVTSEQALSARVSARAVRSTVGAGDAMVAGLVAAWLESADLERTARLGVAFASSKLEQPGPRLGERAHVEALARSVELRVLDRA